MLTKVLVVTTLLLSLPHSASAQSTPTDELKLYFMPAYPVRMDWASPKALLKSSIGALKANRVHMIGHVTIELNCPSLKAQTNHAMTGAAPKSPIDNALLLFRDKIGLSILEASWPGRVESEAEVQKAIDARAAKAATLAVATFEVSETTCARLMQYQQEYAAIETPIHYGNSPRPRRKEGSGCSAFGVSFLEVAGLMTNELRQSWITARLVPLSAMGGYGRDTVSLSELTRMPETERWAFPEEPHMALETFDPDKMYDWVKDLLDKPEELAAMGGKLDEEAAEKLPFVPAVRFNRRNVPTPMEPIFLSEPQLTQIKGNAVIRADKVFRPDGSFDLKP